jgi:hypothetical protein
VAFKRAVREAYRATQVYEYYTSQTYADKGKLFLMRMVSRGDPNLETYAQNLGEAYTEFEESFGLPDVRIAVVSLRDDILQIPRLDAENRAISLSSRITRLRDEISSAKWLTARGYRSVPFATTLRSLSPLTRNHKVHYIETEVVGSDIGDALGRVYLDAVGTGTIRTVGGEREFYRFPEKTAVLNPFFNGQKVFDPSVYKSLRFKDRPFVNSQWQITLNKLDEEVNQDINLKSLTDIRFYIYYTDFTEL